MKRLAQSHLQNKILLHLGHEHTSTLSSIAAELGVTRSSASRAMSALIGAGLVSKEGRQRILTNAGQDEMRVLEQQLPKAAEKAGKAVVRILDRASAAETTARTSTLRGFTDALQAAGPRFSFPDLGLSPIIDGALKNAVVPPAFDFKIPTPKELGFVDMLETINEQQRSFANHVFDIVDEQQRSVAAQLGSIINQTLDTMRGNIMSTAALSTIFTADSSVFTAFQSSIDSFMGQFGEWFKEITRELDTLELAGPVIMPIFLAAGFWVGPSTPMSLLRSIRDHHDAGTLTADEVRRLFTTAYRADDYELLRHAIHHSWNDSPLYAARKEIFLDALDAHIDGKYTLSVPALLPQIEGIACALTSVPHGNTRQAVHGAANKLDTHFVPTISRDVLLLYIASMAYADTRKPAFLIDMTSRGLVLEQVLQRHAILHGITIGYATEENSLRAFLLLDALSRVAIPIDVS